MKKNKSSNPYKTASYQKWSIRRLSIGVASVMLASGVLIFVTPTSTGFADETSKTVAVEQVDNLENPESDLETKPILEEDITKVAEDAKEVIDEPALEPIVKEKTQEAVSEADVIEETSPIVNEALPIEDENLPASEIIPVAVEEPVNEPEMMMSTPEEVKASLADNIQAHTNVPASYLTNAQAPGPFTAGVNQVIPYEAFGGDGMLTRLLLKAANGAPWSDNGTAKNPALLPLDGLTQGSYFYQVALSGNLAGLEGQALLDQLRANGTQTYDATVKVYGAKDGMADMNNLIGEKMVTVTINKETTPEEVKTSIADNIQAHTDVPASYLTNAQAPGPFTAGVNQVIPYEAFGGDGMLTRLLLKAANGAPWSDNGTAKNPALLPLDGLTQGSYFYQVALSGNLAGLEGQALLDQLRVNGTQTYDATVKVYGSKDGMVDMNNLIGEKMVTITINKDMPKMDDKNDKMENMPKDKMENDSKNKMNHSSQMSKDKEMKQEHQKSSSQPTTTMSAKKSDKMLPSTGEESHSLLTIVGLLLTMIVAGVSFLAFKSKKDANS
ncbi:SSURE domain-containing protein [Streptococcus sp. CSL10205-OR2]|uniref:SSURE domain-containing protein n=1 Tax=Streptococcus sp. CSL10205-OR2 TaxID=2980558 RepID=UPI0021DA9918|nr:fibronectin-binding SSURE repeat-containing protein [Streptococcus sp. CSL10205-OR2]MCU9533554.1 fibronectin-binding SSURE repeat-containing protein [Streptococcus sp. CSL10205-OR2]